MKALVVIADGIEELETVTTTDILVRGGVEVTLASVNGHTVVSARGLVLTADALIENIVDDYDVLVCPGGLKGAENLANSTTLRDVILKRNAAEKMIAAICASPALVLAPLKILHGRKATCYPSFHGHLPTFENKPVVVDGHIVTSQGPATSSDFALTLLSLLQGEAVSREVAKQALYT